MWFHRSKREVVIAAPEAHVSHRTPQRLRVKIPSQRGNLGYFSSLKDQLSKCHCVEKFEVNVLTGSVLFINKVDVEAIADYAETNNLFRLIRPNPYQTALSRKISDAFKDLNTKVADATSGDIDIADIAFLTLLGLGGFQISRGNFLAPAWYTAFWYALNIFLKAQPEVSKEYKPLE
jgi:hypothetical protein